jgi:hypothetical protein
MDLFPCERSPIDRIEMTPKTLASTVNWIQFPGFDGLYYYVLEVDDKDGSVEMLMKFDPGVSCVPHRHIGPVKTLVLEGEHIIYKVDDPGELVDRREAGTYTSHGGDEAHIEAGGPEGAVILLSMTSIEGNIWETYDHELRVDRISAVEDFRRGLRKQAAAK